MQFGLAAISGITVVSAQKVITSRFFDEGSAALDKAARLEESLPAARLRTLAKKLGDDWSALSEEIRTQIGNLGVTEEEKQLLGMVRLIGSAKERVGGIQTAQATKRRLQGMHTTAAHMFDTFSDTKKQRVADIYDRIEAGIQKYYSSLHPGEAHTDISLRLSTSKRASTELRMKSFGRADEDPRALTSEGHLDSLGLCIFLAFVKSFNRDCTLVILDDVITTIDSGHRRRVCDLIFSEFREYQLIITTHDGIWYQELAAAQRAMKIDGDFVNVEISKWDLENGPDITKFMPRLERIEERLDVSDKTSAANLSRQYLEWLLKSIALNTNAPVPVGNWNSGTVRDLEPHSRKRLISLVGDEGYVAEVEQAFGHLEKTVIFGNLLSHDNPLAQEVSKEEVREFFLAVRAIHEQATCPSCGSPLEYVRDVKEFRCANARCDSPLIFPTR